MKHHLLTKVILAAAALLSAWQNPAPAQVSVLTQHNDVARTGANLSEAALNTSNVKVSGFGKLFSRSVDAKIWSQPLVLSGVNVPGLGVRNLVYVGTELGTMWAFDADDASRVNPIWWANLVPAGYTTHYHGVIATPVIDPATNTLYATCKMADGNGKYILTLNALDAATGQPKAGIPASVQVNASVPGTGIGSVGGVMTLNQNLARQRPALLLLNNIIYLSFGAVAGEAPTDTFYGWIVGYDATTLQRKFAWCGAPDGQGATLWASGQGPAADSSGNIYVMTGNGTFDANSGGKNYGDSFVKLAASANKTSINVLDYFTPWNEKEMERYDLDLGSAGPLVLPGTNYIVGAGKTGWLYLIDRANMGKHRTDNDSQIVQTFPAFSGHFHGSPVYWKSPNLGPMIYGWSEEDFLKGFRYVNGRFNITPATQSTFTAEDGMPGGFLSLSAYGSSPGTGIIWSLMPFSGDANQGTVPGVLRAFDASDLSRELWNSQQNAGRDALGLYSKFSFVSVANGKVYVPTFSNEIHVFGLLGAQPKPVAPVNLTATPGNTQVVLKWNAVTNAAFYSVKRSLSATGTFTTIAARVAAASYTNTGLTNGTTYFYKVSASNAAGQGPDSNIVSAKPAAPPPTAPTMAISIDFVGGKTAGVPSPMAAGELAGVVRVSNWNNALTQAGTLNALKQNGGAVSTASVTWSANGIWNTAITETAGDARMMKGYLNTGNTTTTTVTVSTLPAAFTQNGYDVYVYCDDDNGFATRSGVYKIGSLSYKNTDAQGVQFNGSYVNGSNRTGNYVKFANLGGAAFTLSATPGPSGDTSPRAPINGLQIVARTYPLTYPTISITSPANNAVLTGFAGANGTASATNGSGIASVTVSLSRLKTGTTTSEYWNGATWGATRVYVEAAYIASSGTWQWNDNVPLGAQLVDGKYTLIARALDNSTLTKTRTANFTLDRTAPTVTISTPGNGATLSGLSSVAGTFSEGGSGIDRVDLVIRRASDNKRWSFTTWVPQETGISTVINGTNWNCTQYLPSGTDLANGLYYLKAVAFDKAGNTAAKQISVTISKPAASRIAASSITVSRAWALAEEDAVQLSFTGRPSEDALSDKNRFIVTVNGKAVPIEGMSYDLDFQSLLLVLHQGALQKGDTVTITRPQLLDTQGRAIVAGTLTIAAQ